MACLSPVRINNLYVNKGPLSLRNTPYIDVPCGHCKACSRARISEISLRLKHEAWYVQKQLKDTGAFVTLTYAPIYYNPDTDDTFDTRDLMKIFVSDEERKRKYIEMKDYCLSHGYYDLMSDPVLHGKEHFQKFMKSLRRQLSYYGYHFKLSYYCVAEYGKEYGRKHYHAIILGCPYSILEKFVKKCWKWCDWSTQDLEKSIVKLDDINKTVAYMCKYMSKGMTEAWYNSEERKLVQKYFKCPRSYKLKYREYIKQLNHVRFDFFKMHLLPFSLRSMGLGKRYAYDNAQRILDDLGVRDGENIKPIPRYYKEIIKKVTGISSQSLSGQLADKRFDYILHLVESSDFKKFVSKEDYEFCNRFIGFSIDATEGFDYTNNAMYFRWHYFNQGCEIIDKFNQIVNEFNRKQFFVRLTNENSHSIVVNKKGHPLVS